MPTSTYPKEWKNRFIFVSPSMIPESFPLRDSATAIDDGVPALSAGATEDVRWRKMYEHPARAFNFPERILSMGGLSPLYPIRPKAFHENKGVVNPEMGGVLGGNTPDVGGSAVEMIDGTPSAKEGSSKGSEDSQHSPPAEDVSSWDEDSAMCFSRKYKPDPVVDVNVAIPAPRSICQRLRSASSQKSQPASRAASKAPPMNTKGSLSKHLKILQPSSSLVSGHFLVS
ncbi:hypothetical protein HanHA300_Chr02g0043741 [Helianthus annuus]|nr:hypothetical protein HanHA300_Chr02g0043741 [Helianthus annuus]KAJ0617919.1 hypothetical protein HanHA89_Chr02g0047211 [Helianthus annuus]